MASRHFLVVVTSFKKKIIIIFKAFTHKCSLFKSLRIDNSGWSVNSSALFDVAGMRWYQRKYHVSYAIRQPIINSIY